MPITDDHEESMSIFFYARYYTLDDFSHIMKYYDRRDQKTYDEIMKEHKKSVL